MVGFLLRFFHSYLLFLLGLGSFTSHEASLADSACSMNSSNLSWASPTISNLAVVSFVLLLLLDNTALITILTASLIPIQVFDAGKSTDNGRMVNACDLIAREAGRKISTATGIVVVVVVVVPLVSEVEDGASRHPSKTDFMAETMPQCRELPLWIGFTDDGVSRVEKMSKHRGQWGGLWEGR